MITEALLYLSSPPYLAAMHEASMPLVMGHERLLPQLWHAFDRFYNTEQGAHATDSMVVSCCAAPGSHDEAAA